MKKFAIYLFAVVLVFAVAGNAAATPCGYGGIFECDTSNALFSACLDGPEINDSVTIFNDNSYFSFNDWEYLSKIEIEEGDDSLIFNLDEPVEIDLTLSVTSSTGGSSKGTFSFNPNTWLWYDNIAIVLKDGVHNDGVYWSAYLLLSGVYSGCWDYDGTHDLSHLSVYGTPGEPVPEPATLLLLGSGLIGLAGIGRRKIKKARSS